MTKVFVEQPLALPGSAKYSEHPIALYSIDLDIIVDIKVSLNQVGSQKGGF